MFGPIVDHFLLVIVVIILIVFSLRIVAFRVVIIGVPIGAMDGVVGSEVVGVGHGEDGGAPVLALEVVVGEGAGLVLGLELHLEALVLERVGLSQLLDVLRVVVLQLHLRVPGQDAV